MGNSMSLDNREDRDPDAARIQRGVGGIDIWLAFYDAADETSLAGFRELMSPQERQQQLRFHFADDRRRYLVTRGMVRTVLSGYADVLPSDWDFRADPFGRPQIANMDGGARELSFNISHTRGLIALGVTRGRALGVDVEHLSVREVSMGVAERYFAPAEVSDLMRTPAHRQQHRFFEYWTFKESYIKARGLGLSIPLDKFSFRCPQALPVEFAVDPDLDDDASRWRFWQCRPTRDHLLAVCAELRDGAVPEIMIRTWMPPPATTVVDLGVQRTSATAADGPAAGCAAQVRLPR
jgi:4'-phosphopantetheinyl transferase